jgi:hypothetical protein
VLKNHTRLPLVSGDIDVCIAPERWSSFLSAYLEALASRGRSAVVRCDHHRERCSDSRSPRRATVARTLQIDLIDRIYWKGTQLLSAEDTLASSVEDPRGFRRVRTGTEAACQLTGNAIRRSGSLNSSVVHRKGILREGARRLGHARRHLRAMHGFIGKVAAERFPCRCLGAVGRRSLAARRTVRGIPQLTAGYGLRPSSAGSSTPLARLPRVVDGRPEVWLRRVARQHRYLIVE